MKQLSTFIYNYFTKYEKTVIIIKFSLAGALVLVWIVYHAFNP